jgi:ATP-dependent Clp protease adaptor protein ClpS
MFNTTTNPFEQEEVETILDSVWVVMLYNDEVNTFDWVIECLVKYCGHDTLQAEQCAWFVHTKGRYPVKHGELEQLIPVCSALCDKGLAAKLEQ